MIIYYISAFYDPGRISGRCYASITKMAQHQAQPVLYCDLPTRVRCQYVNGVIPSRGDERFFTVPVYHGHLSIDFDLPRSLNHVPVVQSLVGYLAGERRECGETSTVSYCISTV